MSGRLGLLAGLAAKHVAMRRRQTLVAVSGVAVGVGFFLAVSAMMIGSQADFIRTLIDAAPHIIISDELRSPPPQPGAVAYTGGAVAIRHQKARTEARGLKDWQEILRAVDEVPGAIGSPSLTGGLTLRLGGREEAIALIGVEPDIESKVSTVEDNLRVGRLRDLQTVPGGLIVGEKAVIVGDVYAEEIVVRGRVEGGISARKVSLQSTCHVEGNILHEALSVEIGAYFEGNCRHSDNPLANAPENVAAIERRPSETSSRPAAASAPAPRPAAVVG